MNAVPDSGPQQLTAAALFAIQEQNIRALRKGAAMA